MSSNPEAASQSTMLGPVPLVPLGRPQLAAAARLAQHGARTRSSSGRRGAARRGTRGRDPGPGRARSRQG